MSRVYMNVVKILMSPRTATDLQEDICENTYLFLEISAYW